MGVLVRRVQVGRGLPVLASSLFQIRYCAHRWYCTLQAVLLRQAPTKVSVNV